MKAKQQQNQNQRDAREIAGEMYRLLGSKARHHDQIDDWSDSIMTMWNDHPEMDAEAIMKIMKWSVQDNDYTVANLRVSRDPGRSLFINQWENVVLFHDAAMAAEKARERKRWKKGACGRCDEHEAKYNRGGWCAECYQLSDHISPLLEKAQAKGMLVLDSNLWYLMDRNHTDDGVKVILCAPHDGNTRDVHSYAHTALMDAPDAVATLEAALAGETPASSRGVGCDSE